MGVPGSNPTARGVRDILEEDAQPVKTATEATRKTFREKHEKAVFIADNHPEYVRDNATARAMWQSLVETFAKKRYGDRWQCYDWRNDALAHSRPISADSTYS